MKREDWDKYLEKTKNWKIRMPHELLHSQAYGELTYAPSVKVLNFFFEKIQVKVDKKKRGKDRYEVVNNGNIDFDYAEAGYRGLSHHQFRRALLDLHGKGFIEVIRPGSVLKDECSLFALSDRWRKYGAPEFERKEFPKSCHWVNMGFGGLIDAKEARRKTNPKCRN